MQGARYEYKFLSVQAIFDHKKNESVLSHDLTDLGMEGWRVIKIVPRGEDFFDIFLERELELLPIDLTNNPYKQ